MRTELFLEKKSRNERVRRSQIKLARPLQRNVRNRIRHAQLLRQHVQESETKNRRADGDYLVWSEQAKVMIDLSLWSLCRYQTKAYQDEDGFRKFVHDEMLALRQMGNDAPVSHFEVPFEGCGCRDCSGKAPTPERRHEMIKRERESEKEWRLRPSSVESEGKKASTK